MRFYCSVSSSTCVIYLESLMWRKRDIQAGDKKGKITFQQFLYRSAHVVKQPLFRQACELAFSECHTGGNHYIFEQELGDSIRWAMPNMDEFEIRELSKLFDTDSDRRINEDDFITCLRRNPLLIALFSPQLMHKNLPGVDDT